MAEFSKDGGRLEMEFLVESANGVVGKKITLPHYMAMFLRPVDGVFGENNCGKNRNEETIHDER